DVNNQIEFFNVREIPTAYIGGGTPSVLGKRISVLLGALGKIPEFKPVEFTVEANPETASEDFLAACLDGGVSRLSLGVQTFHEPSRRAVNRRGNAANEQFALASRYFPQALSVDLITGLPYQDEKTVLDDINRVLMFDPAHISLYSLTLEEGTPLEKKLLDNAIILPEQDQADSLWLSAKDALLKAGFEHYEVSNFARAGKRCLHNIRYWQMEPWLGAGPSASGTITCDSSGTASRYTHPPDVKTYLETSFTNGFVTNAFENALVEKLDKTAFLKETLLMGYRCKSGPNPKLFQTRFGRPIDWHIGKTLERWKGRDIMLFLNGFLSEAFMELVN
ncbi:MAG: coproporphyrinogen III oxidase family protein, partial [Treponema sp.]|nr:coproporphyrinogen III oxidase family protein [Treponema sp.]